MITDGSCLGNPGRGGWAVILRYDEQKRELYGHSLHTTNNRMELIAAIEGLRALKERCTVEVITDSEYLKNGITKWLPNWKQRNWMTADNKKVVNRDLWEDLESEADRHQITWSWTKAHASHEDNNRCDELAKRAALEQLTRAE
jgi:ribonuclease HI